VAASAAASAAVAAAMSVVIVWSSTVFFLVFESALALIGRSFGPFQSVPLSLFISIHPSFYLPSSFFVCPCWRANDTAFTSPFACIITIIITTTLAFFLCLVFSPLGDAVSAQLLLQSDIYMPLMMRGGLVRPKD